MQLDANQVRLISELYARIDDGETMLRTNYSGRAMYSRRCFGFVTNNPLTLFGNMLSELEGVVSGSADWEIYDSLDFLAQLMKNARTDSMGLSSIVYFPNYAWPEELEDEGAEEEDD